jgi:hypothetical protein
MMSSSRNIWHTIAIRVLDGLVRILKLLCSTGDEAFDEESYETDAIVVLVAILTSMDCNAFKSFCVLCLKHIVSASSWRQNYRRRETISNAFTVCDKVYASLVLDNNRDYWKLCYEVGEHNIPVLVESTSASGRATKWRKVCIRYPSKKGSAGGMQGWNREGFDA